MDLSSLLRVPNQKALSLAQQTNQYLERNASTGTSTIPIPYISPAESTEVWVTYERQLLSCLRTGDDKAAHLCLEKLVDRFGATNERVMGLRGLYQEAVAQDEANLNRVLQEYNEILADDPVNAPVAKRRVALLRILARPSDAIDALTELLESSPTDIEAWTELSDLYATQGLYAQAIFCLEEVLLIAPNAWNIHARLGEVLYSSGVSTEIFDTNEVVEAMRRFCRSVELGDGSLRGYYGLKMTSDKLLMTSPSETSKRNLISNNGILPLPCNKALRHLNELATSGLARIVRGGVEKGYDDAEIAAVRALLEKNI